MASITRFHFFPMIAKENLPYLFEYNAQNFVLIFNQKLRVRVIDENCSVLLEIRQNYFGNCRNILLLM